MFIQHQTIKQLSILNFNDFAGTFNSHKENSGKTKHYTLSLCLCVGVLYSRKARIPTLPHLPDKFVEFREEKEQCVSERCYTATNPTSKNDTL